MAIGALAIGEAALAAVPSNEGQKRPPAKRRKTALQDFTQQPEAR